MNNLLPLLLALIGWTIKWTKCEGSIGYGIRKEIFFLNLEDGYFGCQVNQSTDVLQLYELSRLCDGSRDCFQGSDELRRELKCTDNCISEAGLKCQNGACLDSQCHCNDGYGGCSCEVPDENECKYRPCDVFAHCTNTLSSFHCTCFPGYTGDGFHCHDINECENPAIAARCVQNAECCNVPAHFICKCKAGFEGDGEIECRDINECLQPHACGVNAICQNVPGNFSCECQSGFVGNPFHGCVDVDECSLNSCGPGAACTNFPGGFHCECPRGTTGDPYQSCIDLDQCLRQPCGKNTLCKNLPGGNYQCACLPGYFGDPNVGCTDIDECGTLPTACGVNARCTNLNGSYVCDCPPGFTGQSDKSCYDINECLIPNVCGVNAKCVNTQSSFECVCPPGFSGSPHIYCENINECANNPCGKNATCIDTVGSHVCSCDEDFTGNPYEECHDIDECVALDKPCGLNAKCLNTQPGYTCLCPVGYSGKPDPKVACEQVDVSILCRTNFDCTTNAECVEGQCFCQNGFKADGSVCVDINECESQICGPYSTCLNVPGSYHCGCQTGYVGNPPRVPCKVPCEDIKCSAHATCKSDGNDAYCVCEEGWTFDPSDISAGCVDIDECDKSNGNSGRCGINAICANSEGSFSCQCKPGFTGNAFKSCVDINECEQKGICGKGAVCENSAGSYSCKCLPGMIPSPDARTKCVSSKTCASHKDCPGNAQCENKRCVCPEPNIGEDCRHPCESISCGPNSQCMLLNLEAKCLCNSGYQELSTGCVDIDECAGNPCSLGAVCTNEPGGFSCQCPGGTAGEPYQQGCSQPKIAGSCGPKNPCASGEICIMDEYVGENVCICQRGYSRDQKSGVCRDTNECTELRDKLPCGINAICKNLPGSYECQCSAGFHGNPYSICEECNTLECQCRPPYQIVNGECILAACKNKKCPSGAECVTISGGVSYCACPKGFKPKENGTCEDLDECVEILHPCGYGAECVNKHGAYECVCPKGHNGDPYRLCFPTQVQCTTDSNCLQNEKCVQPGECICPLPYFTDVMDGNKCKSPCERFSCGINSQCVAGDPPQCRCLSGYKTDKSNNCVDINECDSNPCMDGAYCINSPGSFKCVCPKGSSGDPYATGCLFSSPQRSQCISNDNCPDLMTCVKGVCVNTCLQMKCGKNTECVIDSSGEARCTCAVGYVLNKDGKCVSECESIVCGRNAYCIIAEDGGPSCKCVDGFRGNPFAGGGCVTDICSTSNPCPAPYICIGGRCKERCNSDVVCGIGATCDPASNKCVCYPFFVGNPDYICMPPISLPVCTPQCGTNARCIYGNNGLTECVCTPDTVGNPYEECGVVERKSCSSMTCGENSLCKNSGSSVECYCPAGFKGNPYVECTDIDECFSNACGINAVCINTEGSYDCRCINGYAGNPFVGCSIIPSPLCLDPETCHCGKNVPCPHGFACKSGKCRSLCSEVKCGPRAECVNGKCVCPSGFTGNPNNEKSGCKSQDHCEDDLDCKSNEICFQVGKGTRKCLDGCAKLQCGPNAVCVSSGHRSNCLCLDGHSGNPSDLAIGCSLEQRPLQIGECVVNADCPEGTVCTVNKEGRNSCVNPCTKVVCGQNEVCSLNTDRNPVCNCQKGYTWNPVASTCEKPSLPECTSDEACKLHQVCKPDALGIFKCIDVCSEIVCPHNAECVASQHRGYCECLPGFNGNANDRNGCLVQRQVDDCSKDNDCPSTHICHIESADSLGICKPACNLTVCGPNSVCEANNHLVQCSCLPGLYVGNASDAEGCAVVSCIVNSDCPDYEACDLRTHSCVHVCNKYPCGENAICLTGENHKAVCQCPPGFKAAPTAEIKCLFVNLCGPNTCHPTALCEIGPDNNPNCYCPSHLIPREDGSCSMGDDCPRGNADCPAKAVCESGRCVDPCQDFCGPNAICLVNQENRKPNCSCPSNLEMLALGNNIACTRPLTACRNNEECDGLVCIDGECTAACRSREDCLNGEKCIQSKCELPCTSDSHCVSHAVCISGLCKGGCRSNKDCPSELSCINNKCQDACIQNACGPNALCVTENSRSVCSCPIGFQRSTLPQAGCVRSPQICRNSAQCPPDYACIDNACKYKCSSNADCVSGERCFSNVCEKVCHSGSNCLVGEICTEGLCRVGCSSDADCDVTQVCKNNKCRCAAGFLYNGHGCEDVNECQKNSCAANAECHNTVGSYHCTCINGTVGDPYHNPGCKVPIFCKTHSDCGNSLACIKSSCANPCAQLKRPCGLNAKCDIDPVTHFPSCSCPTGYLGDPNDQKIGCFKLECVTDGDCPGDKYCNPQNNKCANPCDEANCGKGTCKPQNHHAACICATGYVYMNGKCEDIDECENNICHESALCKNTAGSFTCICPDGLVGDAQKDGCHKPGDCVTDNDCPAEAACANGFCYNPCNVDKFCGHNAECVVHSRKAVCQCPPKTTGDPKIGCANLECVDSSDCSDSKLCAQNTCVDACSLPNACGKQTSCLSTKHVAACTCLPGYTGDARLGCTPLQYCVSDDQCSAGTKCNRGLCFAACATSRDCIRDQLCINNICQVSCTGNSSCPEFQYCDHGLCVQEDGCKKHTECGPNEACRRSTDTGRMECRSVCEGILCGRNAECLARNFEPGCKCKPGYHGNPLTRCHKVECQRNEDCSNDKVCENHVCKISCLLRNPCGENALCSAEKHKQICYCQPGYTGDARVGCQVIDFCARNPCATGARCVNTRGSYKCMCPLGTVGDPFTKGCVVAAECNRDDDCPLAAKCVNVKGLAKCRGVCENMICGPNAECHPGRHTGSCVCHSGFEGNPVDLSSGCVPKLLPCKSNSDCSDNTYCYQDVCRGPCQSDLECRHIEKCMQGQCVELCEMDGACGLNAECRASNHQKYCGCPPGFTGNHEVECVRVPEPCELEKDCPNGNICANNICVPTCGADNDCALNEKCANGSCVLTCHVDNDCFLGHICIGNTCVFGCSADDDCSGTESCRDNKCVDLCATSSPCGPNAVCSVSHHRAFCTCQLEFVPNPVATVGCVRTPAQSCTENRGCMPGYACFKEACRPVCSTNENCLGNERCDTSAGICVSLCQRDDDCRSGEICDSVLCTSGCRSDSDCPVAAACINNKCIGVCASPTACGVNALCVASNHQKICKCASPLQGDPLTGCRHPLISCNSKKDCPSAHTCYATTCHGTCRTDVDCLADERCVGNICKVICNSDAKCNPGQICENRLCTSGCRSDSVCPDNQACINKHCKDPCEKSICGFCAECKVINHGVQCSCPAQFIGNALVNCAKPVLHCDGSCPCDLESGYCINRCSSNNDCSCGQVCKAGKCITKCTDHTICPLGHICKNSLCLIGCRSDNDCANDRTCIKGKCSDACSSADAHHKCGKNSLCRVSEHLTICLCPDGYQGNPNKECFRHICSSDADCEQDKKCGQDKVCRNPCLDASTCGINAQCRVINRLVQCTCPPGYYGNAQIECKQGSELCIRNVCGENTKCRDIQGGYECSCLPGCHGDPKKGCICEESRTNYCKNLICGTNAECMIQEGNPKCYCPYQYPIGDPNVLCSKNELPIDCRTTGCGKGALCLKEADLYVCQCPPGTLGSPNTECAQEMECVSDAECPKNRSCINGQCVDNCSIKGACGINALCQTVLDNRWKCYCPRCYHGNPNVECKPIQNCDTTIQKPIHSRVICSAETDCASNMICLDGECRDPCLSVTCENGKICETKNHKSECICERGFFLNEKGELICARHNVECRLDEECANDKFCMEGKCSDPCEFPKKMDCGNKTCVANNHRAVCVCVKNCNPVSSICLRDNGCPQNMTCVNYKCEELCNEVACPEGSFCIVENHAAICKFCPPGFELDSSKGCVQGREPYPIAPVPSCAHCPEGVPCDPVTGVCVKASGTPKRPQPCQLDTDCLDTEACYNGQCEDICSATNTCSPTSKCHVVQRRPVCSCPSGYEGNPAVNCSLPKTLVPYQPVCQYNEDCPPDELCDRLNRRCLAVCSEDSCGQNAVCIPRNHGFECVCLSGYHGNAYLSCSPGGYGGDGCGNHICGKHALCELDNGNPVCYCPKGMTGNPFEHCVPEGEECRPNPCGPNSGCRVVSGAAVCFCLPEYEGDPPIIPCRTSGNSCSPSQCGPNTRCSLLSNGFAKCTCLDGFVESPNTIRGCVPKVHTQNPCDSTPCGYGALCDPNKHPICYCPPNTRGNPYHECINYECTADKDCPHDKACIGYYCKDPCPGACGMGAVCHIGKNRHPVCNCPPGFTGNPWTSCYAIGDVTMYSPCGGNGTNECQIGCMYNWDCPFNLACVVNQCTDPCPGSCGVYAECSVHLHSPVCTCSPGYTGNPYTNCFKIHKTDVAVPDFCYGGYCGPNVPECILNNDCDSMSACYNNKCINPCEGVCGLNAQCQVVRHCPVCFCGQDYIGDPLVACHPYRPIEPQPGSSVRPANPCKPSPCGPNSRCQLSDVGYATCSCIPGFRNSPPFCKPECISNVECMPSESCVNQKCVNPCVGVCGHGAVCFVLNHNPICACPDGYVGDPFAKCVLPERDAHPVAPVNPCIPNPCGPFSECRLKEDGRAVCNCLPGILGSPPYCRPECLSNSECYPTLACINKKCENPCVGSCGFNTVCTTVNHYPKCQCSTGFQGDPFSGCNPIPAVIEPTAPADPCNPSPCGPNTICKHSSHAYGQSGAASCSCLEGYFGDPYVGCRPECVLNSDCKWDRACLNNKCVDPCYGACGIDAECGIHPAHTPSCSCPTGYTGNPLLSCRKIIDTIKPTEKAEPCVPNPCGANAICKEHYGAGSCSCLPEYVGDPYTGCRPECVMNSECSSNYACINNKCVNPCVGLCPAYNSECTVVNHVPSCSCLPGFTGNAFSECHQIPLNAPPPPPTVPVNPCVPNPCGPNSLCQNHNDIPSCTCLANFIGSPPNCRPECTVNTDCPSNLACLNQKCSNPCVNTCGINAECSVVNHLASCSCMPKFTGDPFTSCSPVIVPKIDIPPIVPECIRNSECSSYQSCYNQRCVNPCSLDNVCAVGSFCFVEENQPICKCPPGYEGNPKIGCHPPANVPVIGCVSNSDCSSTESCVNQLCVSPCNCGPNSSCKVVAHYATCICNAGYDGHPQLGCVKIGCQSDDECPSEKACYNGQCVNPCALGDSCATNAECYSQNHRVECRCLPGYRGDSYVSCEPIECQQDADCPADKLCSNQRCVSPCTDIVSPPCASNAICYVHDHKAGCRCPENLPLGNPLTYCERVPPSQEAEPECRIDSHCASQHACINNKCANPCTALVPCAPSAVCSVLDSTPIRTLTCTCPEGWLINDEGECETVVTPIAPQCKSDSECQETEVCINRRCRLPCKDGYKGTPYGMCIPIGCRKNSECDSGQACVNGNCVPPYIPPICESNDDCSDDKYCVNKLCENPCAYKECEPKTECIAKHHQAVCNATAREVFPPPEMVVSCLADGIEVQVQVTDVEFNGVLYIKGHSKEEECRRIISVPRGSPSRIELFKVLFGTCGLIHINGQASFVLVVQKHPKLVTFKAQAYHIKCVYATSEQNVTIGFNVSMLTTAGTIANTGPPPTCMMRIVTRTGSEINSAEIGENLILQVDVSPESIYGGFARSCVAKTVDNNVENSYVVTDENGCATDPSIFGEWEYNPDTQSLTAEFNAFKFPSSDNIKFQCNIRVCFGKCQPVNCAGYNAYGRRRRRDVSSQNDTDVIDIETLHNGQLREEITIQSNAIFTIERKGEKLINPTEEPQLQESDEMCISIIGLVLALIITALLAVIAVAIATYCWLMAYRFRSRNASNPLPHPTEFPNPIFASQQHVSEPSPDYLR